MKMGPAELNSSSWLKSFVDGIVDLGRNQNNHLFCAEGQFLRIAKHRKLCLAMKGYQPKCSVMRIALGWSPV